jgi:hypothetical protein
MIDLLYLWYTVRTLENVTMYLQYNNNIIFKKYLNIQPTYDLAMAHLSIYPKETKSYVHTKISTELFRATSFVRAQD